MKFELGICYQNKTKKYLLPVIKDYGNELISKINALSKLAVGIDDAIDSKRKYKNHIFILVNIDIKSSNFIHTLDWLRTQPYFEFDYAYDDIVDGFQHMIVLKIPETHKKTRNYFVEDKFSKMYKVDNIINYFKRDDARFGILTRNIKYLKIFVDKVNKDYDTNFRYEQWDGEIELPLKKEQEIFNYKLVNNEQRKRITKTIITEPTI